MRPRVQISVKLPGGADVREPGFHLENHCSRPFPVHTAYVYALLKCSTYIKISVSLQGRTVTPGDLWSSLEAFLVVINAGDRGIDGQ